MDWRARNGEGDSEAEIDFRVAADVRFLELLRGVAARAARIKGFSYGGIEDLALAVDEAAVLLLESRPGGVSLRVSGVTDHDPALTVVVAATGSPAMWPPADLDSDMRWQILQALCDRVWVLDGEAAGIGFSQRSR